MLLMIDNYDSFTYNLVQYFGELGEEVRVFRNDEITLEQIAELAPSRLVVSPGPCTPTEAGISIAAIERFAGQIPILGVCLGHQSIGQLYGGEVVRARQVMHGKTSPVYHAIKYLTGELDRSYLTTLRQRGGLQAYPSRTKDPDVSDFSTGSVGLGAVAPLFSALTRRYVESHFG